MISIDEISKAIADSFDAPQSADDLTFRVMGNFPHGKRALLVAASPRRRAALILPGVYGATPPGFATKRLVAYTAPSVAITMGGAPVSIPATIVECTDAALSEPFGAMVRHIDGLLENQGDLSWPDVHGLLRRWANLFAEGRQLDDREAVGLWGELWVLANTETIEPMLEAWRGPFAGVADFVLASARLEVKTSTRPFVHHLSLTQATLEGAFFLSLAAEEGSGGETLTSLADRVVERLGSPALFYEGLARIGCSLETLDLSKRQRVLFAQPALYRAADMPRVREIDPGITDVRYVASLDPEKALRGIDLEDASRNFGLQLSR